MIILWIYISLKLFTSEQDGYPVWLSFEFTYLSNGRLNPDIHRLVWLSFEFTYLSNSTQSTWWPRQFDYPLNLHISQTGGNAANPNQMFDYPLNLHISQTVKRHAQVALSLIILWIYISLKLPETKRPHGLCLIILWIYISLKREKFTFCSGASLIILWIYISLKHPFRDIRLAFRLIILWIYISLKPQEMECDFSVVWLSFEFTYLSNDWYGVIRKARVWLSFEFTYLSNNG